jgi:hypothetical protein
MKLVTRAAVVRITLFFVVVGVGGIVAWYDMLRMPGESFTGALFVLSAREEEVAARLRADVTFLAEAPRNVNDAARLDAVAAWIETELRGAGLSVERQPFVSDGHEIYNVVGTRRGSGSQVVVVGAHYDSVDGCPGADDNASGVAALLALARSLANDRFERSVRFVAFANEEPPFFQNDEMGSLVYAKSCREHGDDIVAMLSLETIGYYADASNSQRYPRPFRWFYPSTGNFIAFVGHRDSRHLVRDVVATFRTSVSFPSEGAAPPSLVQGVGWSDHWSFWQHGYPNAIMVTDTAPFRYAHYHRPTDTADKLDYERMSRVVTGLEAVVRALAATP